MKQIKDYIGKKVAIYCSSKEEWDKIVDLIQQQSKNSKPTNHFNEKTKNCLNLGITNTCIGTGIKNNYDDFTIYNASEFLEEKQIEDFYIKYSKNFTEDLFNEFFKWAKINIGKYTRGLVPINWNNFINDYYPYIWVNLNDRYKYSQDNHKGSVKKEYSIEDLKKLINYSEKQQNIPTTVQIKLNNEEEYNQLTKWLDSKGFKLWENYDWNYKGKNNNYLQIDPDKYWMPNFKTNYKQLTLQDLEQYGFKYIHKEENEDLIGRYLKALVDNAQCIVCKKGDYFLITSNGNITRVFDNFSGFRYCHDKIGITWELMPKGWKPEKENKPMFEIGKWYKFNNKWYAKMHSQSQCSESIDCDRKYGKIITCIDLSGKNKNNELLTDISEIIQYLPENHPNRLEYEKSNIPEYVEYIDTLYRGQIVKVDDWTPNSYCKVIFSSGRKEQPFKHLIKFSTKELYEKQNMKQEYDYEVVHCETQEQWDFVIKTEGNKLTSSYWKNYYQENTCYCLNSSKKCKDTYSELKWFKSRNSKIYSFSEWCENFNNTPDFMKQEVEEYKVGDYIVPITPENTNGCKLEKGKVYKLKEFYLNSYWRTSDLQGNNNYGGDIYTKDFRKAYSHEIPKEEHISSEIEIGDEVEIHTNHEYGHLIGTRGIVKYLFDNYCNVLANGKTMSHSFKYLKLIKKVSKHNTTENKKVDNFSPKVEITLLRFENDEDDLIDTSLQKIKSIKKELVEI